MQGSHSAVAEEELNPRENTDLCNYTLGKSFFEELIKL
jgi:hypothetical protein